MLRTIFRRFLSISAIYLAFTLLVTLSPVLLPLALIADLFRQNRFAKTRFFFGLIWLLSMEALGILLATVMLSPKLFFFTKNRDKIFLDWNRALTIWWGKWVFFGIQKAYDLRIKVEGGELIEHGPMIIFLRHTSIADVLLGNELIAVPHNIHIRYALKSQLKWEPCEDLVAPRVQSVFVERDTNNPAKQIEKIANLARNLSRNEAVLIYPEGTRFTWKKKQRILSKFEKEGKSEELQYAQSLKYVLPPKLGGMLGLLDANPHADVVFGAHVGFEDTTNLRHFWDGKVIETTIQVKFWRIRASEIPTDPNERIDWVRSQWKRMDEEVQILMK